MSKLNCNAQELSSASFYKEKQNAIHGHYFKNISFFINGEYKKGLL